MCSREKGREGSKSRVVHRTIDTHSPAAAAAAAAAVVVVAVIVPAAVNARVVAVASPPSLSHRRPRYGNRESRGTYDVPKYNRSAIQFSSIMLGIF